MTIDEAIKDCEENDYEQVAEWLKELKAYKETQPSEDCISRQAVLDVINFEDKWLFDAKSHNADTHIAFSGLESRVKALPPVTPQRLKGKWIVISCEPTDIFKCSECGMRVINPYRYCHSCGAKMSGGGEE